MPDRPAPPKHTIEPSARTRRRFDLADARSGETDEGRALYQEQQHSPQGIERHAGRTEPEPRVNGDEQTEPSRKGRRAVWVLGGAALVGGALWAFGRRKMRRRDERRMRRF